MTTRDLRDAFRRHPRLVEEDAAEVLAVGEDLGLQRQERAARVHQIDTGQPVFERHLLRAQVLLHRHRVVGAALDRGVVGDDQHLAPRDAADAGDQASAGRVVVVQAVRRPAATARGTATRIEQLLDPLAHRAACPGRGDASPSVRRRPGARGRVGRAARSTRRVHVRAVGAELGCAAPDLGCEKVHVLWRIIGHGLRFKLRLS